MRDSSSDPSDHGTGRGPSTDTYPTAFPSASAFRPLRDAETEVALLPGTDPFGEETVWCVFSAPLVDVLDAERGLFATNDMLTITLADVPHLRNNYERQRDRIRTSDDRPSVIEPAPEALQNGIDLLVVIEHAVKYARTGDPDARDRHFRRVSALSSNPDEVVAEVEEALIEYQNRKTKTTLRYRLFDRLRTGIENRLGTLGVWN